MIVFSYPTGNYKWLHCSSSLTVSRCRADRSEQSADEMGESIKNADVAFAREIDNIDRGVLVPSVDY